MEENNFYNMKLWLGPLVSYFTHIKLLDDQIESIRTSLCSLERFFPENLFHYLDYKSKGFLGLNDFKQFLNEMQVPYEEKYLRRFIHHFDKDYDFSINFNEFLGIILPFKNCTIKEKVMSTIGNICPFPCVNDEIKNIFCKLLLEEFNLTKDILQTAKFCRECKGFTSYESFLEIAGQDNYISEKHLFNFLKENNMQINECDIHQLMFRLDADNDGCISFGEFQEIFFPVNEIEISRNLENILQNSTISKQGTNIKTKRKMKYSSPPCNKIFNGISFSPKNEVNIQKYSQMRNMYYNRPSENLTYNPMNLKKGIKMKKKSIKNNRKPKSPSMNSNLRTKGKEKRKLNHSLNQVRNNYYIDYSKSFAENFGTNPKIYSNTNNRQFRVYSKDNQGIDKNINLGGEYINRDETFTNTMRIQSKNYSPMNYLQESPNNLNRPRQINNAVYQSPKVKHTKSPLHYDYSTYADEDGAEYFQNRKMKPKLMTDEGMPNQKVNIVPINNPNQNYEQRLNTTRGLPVTGHFYSGGNEDQRSQSQNGQDGMNSSINHHSLSPSQNNPGKINFNNYNFSFANSTRNMFNSQMNKNNNIENSRLYSKYNTNYNYSGNKLPNNPNPGARLNY